MHVLPNTKLEFITNADGTGGLAAALALRKNGIAVRLIEKALDYQIGVRGNGIQVSAMAIPDSLICDPLTNALLQPRILELFKILGLVTDIFDNSIEPPQMRAYDGKTVIRTWDFVQKEVATPAVPYVRTISFMARCAYFVLTVSSSPQPNGRALGQSTTEAILRSHLSRLGVTVELGTELVDFTQDAHKVTANILKRDKSGTCENETLEVDWVIGADGARGYFSLPFISSDIFN
jgi:2-polyprenyl-6-methoxyphenol hydroxylase-like FAD-dependent oxidoreductase